jgi:UPF0755 protein
MRRLVYAFAALCVIGAFVFGIGAMHVYSTLKQTLNIDDKTLVLVKMGGSVSSVAHELDQQGILPSALLLRLYARLTDRTQVKAGEYEINASDTSLSLLEKLIQGDVVVYQLTLVEGWTFKQALNYLHALEKLNQTLTDEELTQAFLSQLNLENNNPEGWFFPDTYRYTAANSDKDILQTAHQRMRDTLATEWPNRDVGLPYATPYQALIMASIIEKETGVAIEREQIAGVFVRRLQNNMRLQTDPTVIYGLGEGFDGNLRRRHLSQQTPYNTYVIRGLPPTPIALPGREAIVAALHPDDSGALYFVAKGDGSHHFSESLEEHNQAVKTYQMNRRNQPYRSSPLSPTPQDNSQ